MSKNSQKSSYLVFIDWLKDKRPKSESLQQPKVIQEQKSFYKKKY